LVPNVPFRRMRLLALLLSPRGFLAFNENLNHFMLRPASAPAIARHFVWRLTNALRWGVRSARKADWPLLARYGLAILAGHVHAARLYVHKSLWGRLVACGGLLIRPSQADRAPLGSSAGAPGLDGITVVIPSRTGRALLEAQLPDLLAQAPDQ